MVQMLGTEPRPPYVKFEERSQVDRSTNPYSTKIVDWAIVRQMGSKDTFEKEALEYLKSLQHDPNMRREWVTDITNLYKHWKAGNDVVTTGFDIRNWNLISKGRAEVLIANGIRSVEDMAHAPEPALMSIGMGARELQRQAKAWLASADQTRAAAEIESQAQLIDDLKKGRDELLGRVRALEAESRQRAAMATYQQNKTEEDFLGAGA